MTRVVVERLFACRGEETEKSRDKVEEKTYVNCARVENVEVVSVVTLFDDGLVRLRLDGEHGVEYVLFFSFVQMAEQNVLLDGLRQGGSSFLIFWDILQETNQQST